MCPHVIGELRDSSTLRDGQFLQNTYFVGMCRYMSSISTTGTEVRTFVLPPSDPATIVTVNGSKSVTKKDISQPSFRGNRLRLLSPNTKTIRLFKTAEVCHRMDLPCPFLRRSPSTMVPMNGVCNGNAFLRTCIFSPPLSTFQRRLHRSSDLLRHKTDVKQRGYSIKYFTKEYDQPSE